MANRFDGHHVGLLGQPSTGTASRRNGFRLKSGGLVALCFLVVLTFFHHDPLYRFIDHFLQKNPFSGQKEVEKAFSPTPRELACLWQTAPRRAVAAPSDNDDPIPNIVHFVFLQNPKAGSKEFDFLSYLAIRSALISIKPTSLQLHYALTKEPSPDDPHTDPLKNPWINRLKDQITIVKHPHSEIAEQKHPAHAADIIRLQILRQQGGIYLDIDAYALRPFTNLLHAPHPHDIVMGHEGGNRAGLCNAVVVARANSTFLKRWIGTYQDADLSKEWNYHSVILPKKMSKEFPTEICTLPPDAFFWPTWTWDHIEWMHQPLHDREAKFWADKIEHTGGSLFDNQLTYHAWGQMGWERYLKYLTPTIIRSQDTRFNLLMRRFVEDDL